MKKIAVLEAKRAPIGKIPGKLNFIGETELMAIVFAETAKRYEGLISEAVLGASFPIEKDNLCRKAVLKAGLPAEISAVTVSKTCASSDEALRIACERIRVGETGAVLVGGSEKVSNSPYMLRHMKKNVKLSLKGQMPWYSEILDNIAENDMAYLYETISRKYGITREAQDAYTLRSIEKAAAAGKRPEIIPVSYANCDREYYLDTDEMPLNAKTEQEIRNAGPMFLRDGFITQYNAAIMCDCSCAMLIMDFDLAAGLGLKPEVSILDTCCLGVPKDKAGQAMRECASKAVEANGLNFSDIDLFEINESFAAQAIFTIEELGLDMEKVNRNGGSLALGYPVGAAGLRMNVSLVNEMIRSGAKFGLSVMCAGGNMANAAIFKREGGK